MLPEHLLEGYYEAAKLVNDNCNTNPFIYERSIILFEAIGRRLEEIGYLKEFPNG